jgi:hypothetical protein
VFPHGLWHVLWDRFTAGVAAKLRPVTLLETLFVDGRMCRVKTQFPRWMPLQATIKDNAMPAQDAQLWAQQDS